MKKLILLVLFFASVYSIDAQIKIGGGGTFILDKDGTSMTGVHARGILGINKTFHLSGSAGLILTDGKAFIANADVMMDVIKTSGALKVIPFVGANLFSCDDHDDEFGLNIGASLQYATASGLTFYLDPKYTLSSYDSIAFNVGLLLNI